MRTGYRNILLFAFFVLTNVCFSQNVIVKGGFLTDSIKIGEEAAFYLSARYPSKLSVLFPDSTFAFTPFEFQKKIYFATETTDTISVDSAVYFMTTFEVDREQVLRLPVYVINPADCTQFLSEADTIL